LLHKLEAFGQICCRTTVQQIAYISHCRVVALLKAGKPGPFAYLQGMRQGTLKAVSADPEKTEIAQAYRRNEQKYCAMLAKAVQGPIDAVLSPPSRMAWQAEPYRRAIAEAHRTRSILPPR
jgi:hypothetical protein